MLSTLALATALSQEHPRAVGMGRSIPTSRLGEFEGHDAVPVSMGTTSKAATKPPRVAKRNKTVDFTGGSPILLSTATVDKSKVS